MNKIHKRRLYLISIFITLLALATGLILFALKQNINVFLTPAQLSNAQIKPDYHLRLGGVVKMGSVQHVNNSLNITFVITDYKKDVPVKFNGVLPDLFREGKGVIAEGYFTIQGDFIATQVLAKHDENYMPKNVYKALREGNK